MKTKFILWVERIKSSHTLTLGGLAILVGLATGVGVWIFKWLFEFVHGFAFGSVSGWTVALVPVLGGLLVGLIAHYFIGDEKVHGTAAIMQVFILRGDTMLHARDMLVVVAEGQAREEVVRLCQRPDSSSL